MGTIILMPIILMGAYRCKLYTSSGERLHAAYTQLPGKYTERMTAISRNLHISLTSVTSVIFSIGRLLTYTSDVSRRTSIWLCHSLCLLSLSRALTIASPPSPTPLLTPYPYPYPGPPAPYVLSFWSQF